MEGRVYIIKSADDNFMGDELLLYIVPEPIEDNEIAEQAASEFMRNPKVIGWVNIDSNDYHFNRLKAPWIYRG
jgi:hypothetical protein